MIKINSTNRVKEIIEQYPETLSLFNASGFNADTANSLVEELGEFSLLTTALKVKGLNEELFIKMLEDKIADNTSEVSAQHGEAMPKLNFLGYTYCPLKHTFRECFEEVLEKYLKEGGETGFTYYVPSGCSKEDPYENLWKAEDINSLPDIIASVGFGDFFRKEFTGRFIRQGFFKSIAYSKVDENFKRAGFPDPDGHYTIYSVFPLVMLIDKKRIGKLPVPGKWADLLNPVYKNNITIGAAHGEIHHDLLIYLYKDHGEEGLIKLAANVKNGWHASQMAKAAGSNNSAGTAIYVLPWMFARSCPKTKDTLIVWPEEGAVTSPIYMLAKESTAARYKPFIDFLTGTAYGQKSADNYFPVANGAVRNKLPADASLKWLGWDYIKSHSMEQLKAHTTQIFLDHWENADKKEEDV